jgi:hypothetical protein
MKKFSKDYLVEELDLPCDVIEDDIFDTSRWSEHHWIVFKDTDGKHYETCYSCGATEMQDEPPWEYDNEVECHEVELKEVVIKKWVRTQQEEK